MSKKWSEQEKMENTVYLRPFIRLWEIFFGGIMVMVWIVSSKVVFGVNKVTRYSIAFFWSLSREFQDKNFLFLQIWTEFEKMDNDSHDQAERHKIIVLGGLSTGSFIFIMIVLLRVQKSLAQMMLVTIYFFFQFFKVTHLHVFFSKKHHKKKSKTCFWNSCLISNTLKLQPFAYCRRLAIGAIFAMDNSCNINCRFIISCIYSKYSWKHKK